MGERGLISSGNPKLLVECENLCTLMAVAKVINESGLNAKVLMEYEVSEYGGNKNAKNVENKKKS